MLENDLGVDFLPMRLIAALITASIILVMAAAYATQVAGQSSKIMARACADRVAGAAAAEYAEGCPGSGGTRVDVVVPNGVRAIVFGMPPQGGPDENYGGSYIVQYADGSSESYLIGMPLGSGSLPGRGGPAVLYPGRYKVNIRIEAVNGSLMALIYAEAA